MLAAEIVAAFVGRARRDGAIAQFHLREWRRVVFRVHRVGDADRPGDAGSRTAAGKDVPADIQEEALGRGYLGASRHHRFADDVSFAQRIDVERAGGEAGDGVRSGVELPARQLRPGPPRLGRSYVGRVSESAGYLKALSR